MIKGGKKSLGSTTDVWTLQWCGPSVDECSPLMLFRVNDGTLMSLATAMLKIGTATERELGDSVLLWPFLGDLKKFSVLLPAQERFLRLSIRSLI